MSLINLTVNRMLEDFVYTTHGKNITPPFLQIRTCPARQVVLIVLVIFMSQKQRNTRYTF